MGPIAGEPCLEELGGSQLASEPRNGSKRNAVPFVDTDAIAEIAENAGDVAENARGDAAVVTDHPDVDPSARRA